MRRRLTKKERKIVYDKCGGHCAYCGCEIPFNGFHADHVRCLRNFEHVDESIDTVDNMLPACSSCNRYKSTYDLETFRKMLSGIPKRLARDSSTYNIALRFGMIEEHHDPVQFYFEIGGGGMTENEAIKELKDENEQCYEQCEGFCSEVINNVCTCRDATILSALEQYRAIGTVEECREAMRRQRR